MGSAKIQTKSANVGCKKCGKSLKGKGGIRVAAGQSAGSVCVPCIELLLEQLGTCERLEVGDTVVIVPDSIRNNGVTFDPIELEIHRVTKTTAVALVEDPDALSLLSVSKHDEISFPIDFILSETEPGGSNCMYNYIRGATAFYFNVKEIKKEV